MLREGSAPVALERCKQAKEGRKPHETGAAAKNRYGREMSLDVKDESFVSQRIMNHRGSKGRIKKQARGSSR